MRREIHRHSVGSCTKASNLGAAPLGFTVAKAARGLRVDCERNESRERLRVVSTSRSIAGLSK